MRDPKAQIGLGLILVLLGAVVPFTIVLGYLPSTLWLNFLSYGMSIVGLFLGYLGASAYVRGRRRDE